MDPLAPPSLTLRGKSNDWAPVPYRGYGLLAAGMTGYIHQLHERRVVKVARVFPLDDYLEEARQTLEFSKSDNHDALKREKAIYQRLDNYKGVIHCFKASDDGIELAFAGQGDLEAYIKNNNEPQESFKTRWILSLADTLSFVHSRKVFVDEIALRNILVTDEELKLVDFGQSVLLPIDTDMDTI
jgi:serine/threonine protein kinase